MSLTPLAALATNVRRLRQAHNLSLGQLSERSGVASATLFKVERQATNPTLDTLVALAESFSVSVASLLTATEQPRVQVTRAGDGEDVSDAAMRGRILMRVMEAGTTIEVYDAEFIAGQHQTSVSHGEGSREHVMCRSGRICLGPVSEQVELGPGDYATYPTDGPHRWRPVGSHDARVLIFHTYPSSTSRLIDDGLATGIER